MESSVIIPTLNEADCIEYVLSRIPKDAVDEILVVDGHSTDGTPDLVRKLGYKVIMQEGRGYGLAVSTGVKHAKGDVVVFMDADGSHNPEDIPRLIDKIADGYDVVLASRYMPGSSSQDDTLVRYVGNKLFTYLVNKIHKIGVSDSLFLFAAVRKKVFESIELASPNFEYCVEILIKAHKAGLRFAEIPSVELERYAGDSKVNEFYHGLRILWTIIKERF